MLTRSDLEKLSELQHAVHKKVDARLIAAEIDKAYSTYMAELSPFNDSHKHGLHDFIAIMDYSGEFYELLNFLANRYGHHLVPNPDTNCNKYDLQRLVLQIGKENGDIIAAYLRAKDPDGPDGENIDETERAAIIKEIDEEIRLLNQLKADLSGE
jgi:tRNA U34 2-thiouridine synthase MnmA/TrmU